MKLCWIVCIAVVLSGLPMRAPAETLVQRVRLRGFVHPKAVFDGEGNVFVADGGNNRVIKYSPRGDSIAAVSGSGWGDNQFDNPCGVAMRGVDLFVADYGNHRVQRFDRNLNFVATLYTRENVREQERFGYPRGVAVSAQGDLYVIDGENIRIVKITPFGQVERTFGSTDAGAQRLLDPECICADPTGLVHVIDKGTLKRFDAFGTPRSAGAFPAAKWCSAGSEEWWVLTDSTLIAIPAETNGDMRRIELPPGGPWLGCTATVEKLALWTDSDVVIFSLPK